MQRWEYLTIVRKVNRLASTESIPDELLWDVDITQELARAGQWGWELVAVVPHTTLITDVRLGRISEQLWVFKRPIVETAPLNNAPSKVKQ